MRSLIRTSAFRAAAVAPARTTDQILDLAEMLIQTRGFCAFSYQDIADKLGIRKASIHYHFASKGDLGVAVIERYSSRFAAELAAIAAAPDLPAAAMLDRYIAPFVAFAGTPDRVCLSAALAAEIQVLPAELRRRVDAFFTTHQAWLAGILERGAARGEFVLPTNAASTARLVFSALQGALLVKRTTGEMSQVLDVVAAVKQQLAPAGGRL